MTDPTPARDLLKLRSALLGWVRVPWADQFAKEVDVLIAAARADEATALRAEVERLRAALTAVKALHQPDPDGGMGYKPDDASVGRYGHMSSVCLTCGTSDEYGVVWPCATIRAALAAPEPTR